MNEINNGGHFNYPGESRDSGEIGARVKTAPIVDTPSPVRVPSYQSSMQESSFSTYETREVIPQSERVKLNSLIAEIKEINSHVKYSIEHIENRIKQIERIIKKYT